MILLLKSGYFFCMVVEMIVVVEELNIFDFVFVDVVEGLEN